MTQDDQRRRAEEFLKRASFLPDAIALLAPVLANFAAEAIEQLPAAPATDDWIAYSESPNVDGFYWCYTDCPPQSHPQQALRFKDRNWMTSWPVLYWSKLRPPPVSGAKLK